MTIGTNADFNFSTEQLETLKSILGNSDLVLTFLGYTETIIGTLEHTRKYDKGFKLSNTERKKKIEAIKKNSKRLALSIEEMSFKWGVEYSDEEFSNHDMQTCCEIQQTWIESNEPNGFAPENYIHDMHHSLNEFEKRCSAAIKSIENSDRGKSASWTQVLNNDFDRSLVFHYRCLFRCFPATTHDGAFCNAMKEFYKAAKFPSSNIQQRVMKEIRNQRENAKISADELKPIPKLHPHN